MCSSLKKKKKEKKKGSQPLKDQQEDLKSTIWEAALSAFAPYIIKSPSANSKVQFTHFKSISTNYSCMFFLITSVAVFKL